MTYTVTHLLGHIHGTYNDSTTAHNEVLKLLPLSKSKASKLLNRLASSKAGSTIRVEYDNCEVLVTVQ
jgi:hypothetical protein